MESTASVSKINWTEIGTTAAVVFVFGFAATLAAIYASRSIDKAIAKKPSSNEGDSKEPKKA